MGKESDSCTVQFTNSTFSSQVESYFERIHMKRWVGSIKSLSSEYWDPPGVANVPRRQLCWDLRALSPMSLVAFTRCLSAAVPCQLLGLIVGNVKETTLRLNRFIHLSRRPDRELSCPMFPTLALRDFPKPGTPVGSQRSRADGPAARELGRLVTWCDSRFCLKFNFNLESNLKSLQWWASILMIIDRWQYCFIQVPYSEQVVAASLVCLCFHKMRHKRHQLNHLFKIIYVSY